MRLRILLAALAAAALGASWYFAVRDDTTEPQQVAEVADVRIRDGVSEPRVPEPAGAQRVKTFSGLQTTVPDTLGYDERTATYALEDGGFRVRVMYHAVSRSSDSGVVVQQLPRGGVTRRVGWIVTIVVGRLR